jgi:penicillin G amidase
MSEALPQPARPDAPAAPTLPADAPRRGRRALRRAARVFGILLLLLVVAAVALGLWARSTLRGSLPLLDGERAVAGLAAPVEVERDALGVPTIRAGNRPDAYRALGFLHAQDRFFQMDLMRRQAAGELSELFGAVAVEADRGMRVHGFRGVARRAVESTPPESRAILEAYADGVNAGLGALEEPPFEYAVLRLAPAPWRPEDSILVVHAMFVELQDENGRRESDRARLSEALPRELAEFLAPAGTPWDAPVVGEPFPVPPIPGPEVFDLRTSPPAESASRRAPVVRRRAARFTPWGIEDERLVLGSNNWAVAGTHTADGRALLANDMHLGIRVPNTWYRASIVLPDGEAGTLRVTGVTLPGAPALVVGSNGHVAWGFTNSYGDWNDLVILEVDPADPEVYRTPDGPRRFGQRRETLRVKGGDDVTFEVRETIWGPVIDEDRQGRPRALAWTAHHPEAVNLNLGDLESARTLEQAMAVANRSGAPAQNFTVADSTGRVGWTILGRMPRRVGFDGSLPTSWADGSRGWDGWLAPEEAPRVVDPPSGRVWTANARVVDGEMLALLGDGGYDLGARARQIRDGLFALDQATPRDLLAIQLDDRALFLSRWRDLLLETLDSRALAADPRRRELRRVAAESWTGRASTDSAGYRAVRGFRSFLVEQVWPSLTGQQEVPDDERSWPTRQFEGALWRLVTERPAHLLDPRFRTWDEQLLAAADAMLDYYQENGGGNVAERTWGERNTTRIRHPLSAALPFAGRWLDVPTRALPGDEDMPRVQGPVHGASERLVVSPGHEEEGFFHMPVGQSGHPLSPFYRAGHEAWENGEPTPFLPGPAEHRLRLMPGG